MISLEHSRKNETWCYQLIKYIFCCKEIYKPDVLSNVFIIVRGCGLIKISVFEVFTLDIILCQLFCSSQSFESNPLIHSKIQKPLNLFKSPPISNQSQDFEQIMVTKQKILCYIRSDIRATKLLITQL